MNLVSNDGELVVVETLRQEICFSALTLRASKFSIDRRSRRQTPHLTLHTLFLCVSCDPRIIHYSDFVFYSNCCCRSL